MITSQLGELLREGDWEDSTLGPPAIWPPLLIDTFRQINNTLLPACILWGDEHFVIYNTVLSKIIPHNALGKALNELSGSFWEPIGRQLKSESSGTPLIIEQVATPGNGDGQSTRYFNIFLSPLLTEAGQNVGLLLTFIETTEQIKAQEAAKIAQENFSSIIRHAPVAMAALRGKDLVVEIANHKVCEMWGKPYEECINKPIFEIIPEVKGQGFEDLVHKVMVSGESMELAEIPVMVIHDGKLQQRYMTFSYEPIKNLDGEIDGIVTVGIDVTDSIQIRQEFTQAQERTKIAVEAAAIGIFELTLSTDEIITSERFDEIFDVPSSCLHQDYLKIIHPEDLEEWKRTVEAALSSGKLFQQYRINKSDGSICYVQTLGRVYYDENNKPVRILGTAIDVTAQVEAKQKLDSEQRHSHMLLNSIPAIAWSSDTNGDVNFYNQRWYDYTGLNFEETKSWGWKAVIHPDDLQYNITAYTKILAGNTAGSFEIREKSKDGMFRWHLVNIEPVRNNDGNITQWIGTATDIQRLKELEQQKDEFISIASHELKTPLTSVKAFNQIMYRSEDQVLVKELAKRSRDHIARLEKLINDLLNVSRINSGKLSYNMQNFDFEKMLAESIDSVKMTTEKHQIVLHGCDQIVFHGDADRLEQVMNNLLNNAVKYSPKGGTISVNCSVDNKGLTVAVADQGIGIEKHHLNKLFDRYYRIDNTAMRFSGLGLGLYICSEIIKRHDGSMWIESEPGEGSTFYFRLPLGDNNAEIEIDEENIYKDKWITIKYTDGDKWIDCQWHGYQNVYSIKRACLRLLAMAVRFKISKILADNTYVEGTWTDATDWVAKEFYPMMDEAGIRQLAWVHSKSAFSQLAAEKTVDLSVGLIITRFFDSVDDGLSWLIN